MIANERVVALIPARAGSKGVPGKNIRPLGGRPLIAWSIELALEMAEIDRVVVSTDGEEIARVARGFGAEVLERPAELATDDALSADVVRDVRARLREDGETARYMVLLQPTNPFRQADDVRRCLRMLHERGLHSVATFMEARLNPTRAFRIVDGVPEMFIDGADPWPPRQLLPPAHELNGAVYTFVADALPDDGGVLFGRGGAVLMDSLHSVDIDDEVDFDLAETLLARGAVR